MLLRLSKLAAALSEGVAVSSLPGVAPDPKVGQDAMQEVQHGMEGRLLKGLGVGNKLKTTQGPRAYAPRLSKP